jgi:hypothetical protein
LVYYSLIWMGDPCTMDYLYLNTPIISWCGLCTCARDSSYITR